MLRKVITGVGVWTSAGRGPEALLAALKDRRAAFDATPPYPHDGLKQPKAGIIGQLSRDRPAEQLLLAVAADALAQSGLDPRATRTGAAIGTTSGNISGPWERWHRAVLAGEEASEEGTERDAPTRLLVEHLGLAGPSTTVSVACASGTAAFAVASGWLEDGLCDAVLVGGVDALSLYIHAGFNGLGALASEWPRPFSEERDGLLLGDGGGVLVLETAASAEARGARALVDLLGAGMSGDAFHVTAPHREGRGAARSMGAALADAAVDPERIDMISAHGTATVFNDAMESRAFRSIFGDRPVAFHGIKGCVGHTLGAAGAVEAALLVHAMDTGVQPPSPPSFAEDCPVVPPPEAPGAPALAISTNSAFGGANAAAVFALPGLVAPRDQDPVEVVVRARAEHTWAPGRIDLRASWPDAPSRLARSNRFVRTGVLAVREVLEGFAYPEHTGLVLATSQGCRLTDLRYHQRLVEEGAGRVSRMEFIYTIPGSPVAETSILFGLQGPNLTLVGPWEQAEEEAARLIRWGRCEVVVALACDAPDPGSPARARAALLTAGG